MRLSKNFGLLTFPVFRPYRYFDGRNKSGKLTLVSNVRKFCETYRKSYRNTEIFDICWKFRYIFDIFDKSTAILDNFAKLYQSSKLLPKRMALMNINPFGNLSKILIKTVKQIASWHFLWALQNANIANVTKTCFRILKEIIECNQQRTLLKEIGC